MQSDINNIYKLTSLRTGKDEKIYKDIGRYVFGELASNIRKPKSLIIRLRGLGTFYLRKRRMEVALEHFPPDWETELTEENHSIGNVINENKKNMHNIFKERLKDYDRFLEFRNSLRTIRRKSQFLIPIKEDDND